MLLLRAEHEHDDYSFFVFVLMTTFDLSIFLKRFFHDVKKYWSKNTKSFNKVMIIVKILKVNNNIF